MVPMTQTQDIAPAYPALTRVLLVESRHGVRVEVLKSLAAAHLFEEVIQPDSMADALDRIGREEFDACIIGSSVRRERASDFLRRAAERSRARDCAFVVLVRDGEEAVVLMEADNTLRWPCSKREFTEGLVLGVLSANSESTWASYVRSLEPGLTPVKAHGRQSESPKPSILNRPNPTAPASLAALAAQAMAAASPTPPVETKFQPPLEPRTTPAKPDVKAASGITIAELFTGDLVNLSDVVEAVRRKEIGLDPNGSPNRLAKIALAQVVQRVFPANLRSPKIEQFREFFVYCLERWLCETVNRGEERASTNLKERLIAYSDKFTDENSPLRNK